MQNNGRILMASGGFYDVLTPQGLVRCRARGLFRKEKTTPYVGDQVVIEPTQPNEGYIIEILPRKNFLLRPPLANLDVLAVVVSTTEPVPSTLVIDTMLAVALHRDITPIIIITKTDLATAEALEAIYRPTGIEIFCLNPQDTAQTAALRQRLANGITAFSGNSGVGKSTLLNALFPKLTLATAAISQKLGRGKHTTRHVQLYPSGAGGYVADTPGFSSAEIEELDPMPPQELWRCYPEFAPHGDDHCRFRDCMHLKEVGCGVLKALTEGIIPPSRHQNYLTMYQRLKDVPQYPKK